MERKVREAVRIQLRSSVLNRRGEFNRSKLTRVMVDTKWDKEVWDSSWSRIWK